MPPRSSTARVLDRLRGRRWLVAVCVGVAVGETLLVSSLLSASSVALATQASDVIALTVDLHQAFSQCVQSFDLRHAIG